MMSMNRKQKNVVKQKINSSAILSNYSVNNIEYCVEYDDVLLLGQIAILCYKLQYKTKTETKAQTKTKILNGRMKKR